MNVLVDIRDENHFQELLQSELPVLVDFWAPWCGPCKAMTPILQEVAEQYTQKITVAKLNIDTLITAASNYNVGSIPHCILFQGGEALGTITGLQSKKGLTDFLKEHLPTL